MSERAYRIAALGVLLLAGLTLVLALAGTVRSFRLSRAVLVAVVAAALLAAVLWHRSPLRPIAHRFAARPSALAVLTGVAFLLRLAWVLSAGAVQVSDFAGYLEMGRNLAVDGYFGLDGVPWAFRPPGWPFVLSLLHRVGADPALGAGILNAALSATCVPAVFLLARGLAGRGAALLAAGIFAFLPSQVLGCSLAATEPVFTALLAWSVVLAVRVLERSGEVALGPSLLRGILLGALLGAATYVRSLALPVPFALLLACLALGPRRRGPLLSFAVAGAVVVLGLVPWGLRNERVLGEFRLLSTNGGTTLYQANNPRAGGGFLPRDRWPDDVRRDSELETDRVARETAIRWIRENPERFLALIPRKWVSLWGNDVDMVPLATNGLDSAGLRSGLRGLAQGYYLALLALAAVGTCRLRRLGPFFPVAFTLLLLTIAVHTLFHGQPRFHAPLLPLFVVLAALGGTLVTSRRAP